MDICPGCKKPLAPDSPQGLCPECLLKAGLGTGMDIGPDSAPSGGPDGRTGSVRARFVAPTPEELATAFPQLDILGFIGQGGMGAVYKARQKALDRVVALKILPPGIGDDPAFAERFAREAKALARLNHPGIVTLYEFGQADGLFYFLMEFVDGVNLRHLLEAGRLSPREALAIVPQICDALQYAHDQGIVHRDIKPENILLDRLGRVKVADFGLAKLVGTGEGPSAAGDAALGSVTLTEAGKVMGTPQYMAPEQSETPATVDHRADIYSLGVVLYQMLTGELPGKPIEPPSRTVQIDVRLDEVVLRALEKEPERRYQQVSQVKTAVEGITQSPPQEGADPSVPVQPSSVSIDVPIKSARGRFTTPEFLATLAGGFVAWKGKGDLSLYADRLVFASGWQRTEIPFTGLRELGRARPPRWLSPAGHTFLSIVYDDAGQNRRLLFFPGEALFRFTGNTRAVAAEWIVAIRDVMKAATGKSLPDGTGEPSVVNASPWGATLVLALPPMIWLGGLLLLAKVMGPTGQRSLLLPLMMIAVFYAVLGFAALQAWRREKDMPSSQSPEPADASPQVVDWGARSPFQPPRVREICAHMTKAEKREATLRGAMFGVWIAATWFGPFFAWRSIPEPANLIAPIIFLVGFAGIPIWRRMQREFLCATAWARQQALQPDQLGPTGIIMVGRRDGKAVIRWRGVLLTFLLILAGMEAGTIYSCTIFLVQWIDLAVGIAFMGAIILTGHCVRLNLRTPVEWLTPLDGSSERGPATTIERKAQVGEADQVSDRPQRMSRAAVWGAIWALYSLTSPFLCFFSMQVPAGAPPPLWLPFLMSPAILLALAAPFGTTTLGWVALSQIRRSSSRLYGLGLAVFDGLLFPLLALDGVIAWVLWTGTKLYVDFFVSIENLANPHYNNWRKLLNALLVEHRVGVVFVLTLAMGGLLSFLIVRRVWRAVNKPLGGNQRASDTAATPDTGSRPRSGRGCLLGGCLGAFGIVAVWFLSLGVLSIGGVLWGLLGGGQQPALPGASADPTAIRRELGHVSAPKPKELTITRAQYGAGDANFDVTSQVRDRIKENTLSVSASNDLAGDPAWGRTKRLTIEYVVDGVKKSASVPEGGTIEIPGLAPIDNLDDLLTFVKVCPAEVGFFAMDLTTGKTVEYRPDQPACMASIVKLFTLLEVMSQVQAGQLTLSDTIRVGVKSTTINEALDLMIGMSDNTATAALTARVGYDRVNALPRELDMAGLSDQILPKPGVLNDVLDQRISGPKAASNNSLLPQHATARGMVKYFELLNKGNLKSPDVSRDVLAVLDRHPRGFVPNAPAGFTVVGKGGSLGWNRIGRPQYNVLGWNVYLRDEKTSLALCVWCEWFPEKMTDELRTKWCSAISDGIVNVLLSETRDRATMPPSGDDSGKPRAETGAGPFGPVIEKVIATSDADDQGLVFFEMETGKSFKPPFPLAFHPNQGPAFVDLTPELKQWIKDTDVDLLLHLGGKTWDMMTLEMQEEFAGQLNGWETVSPETVIGVFAKKDADHLVRDEVPASSFGHSYGDGFGSFNAFRTRGDRMGVYQFEGVDNSTRRGVGIRYKLVQAPPSAPASG